MVYQISPSGRDDKWVGNRDDKWIGNYDNKSVDNQAEWETKSAEVF